MKAMLFVALTIAASWLLVGLYFVCGGTWTIPVSLIIPGVSFTFDPMALYGGNDLTVGLTGLAGFIVVGVVNLGLLLAVSSQQSGKSTHAVVLHPDPHHTEE